MRRKGETQPAQSSKGGKIRWDQASGGEKVEGESYNKKTRAWKENTVGGKESPPQIAGPRWGKDEERGRTMGVRTVRPSLSCRSPHRKKKRNRGGSFR